MERKGFHNFLLATQMFSKITLQISKCIVSLKKIFIWREPCRNALIFVFQRMHFARLRTHLIRYSVHFLNKNMLLRHRKSIFCLTIAVNSSADVMFCIKSEVVNCVTCTLSISLCGEAICQLDLTGVIHVILILLYDMNHI